MGYEKMQRLDDEIKQLEGNHLELMQRLAKYREGSENYKETMTESAGIEAEIKRKKEEKEEYFLSINFSTNDGSEHTLVNDAETIDLVKSKKMDTYEILNLLYMEFSKYDTNNNFRIYQLFWNNCHYGLDFAVREIKDALDASMPVAVLIFDQGARHFSALYLHKNKAYYFDSLSYELKPKIAKHLKKYAGITEIIDKTLYSKTFRTTRTIVGFTSFTR